MDERIKIFLNGDIDFPENSKRQIEQMFDLDDIQQVVVLPDVHTKEDRTFPKGIAVLTKNTIYPGLISEEMGCGVRAVKTDLYEDNISQDDIDAIFSDFESHLKRVKLKKGLLNKKDYKDLLGGRRDWISREYGEHLVGSMDYYGIGDFGKKIAVKRALPLEARIKGYKQFGSLGGGNHFLEMHAVRKIMDEHAAEKVGLNLKQIIFVLHTGGILPGILTRYYTQKSENKKKEKRFKKNFRKFLFHFNDWNLARASYRLQLFFRKTIKGIPADTPEGVKFLAGLRACMDYTFANRCFLSKVIETALNKRLNNKVNIQTVSDIPHETISREEFSDEKFWVHRYGASRVYPFDIVYLPSYMGADSFFCMADEGIEGARFSLNHGVGRNFTKSESKKNFSLQQVEEFLKSRQVRLYDSGNLDILEQAPFAFKDIDLVIKSLQDCRLAKPVVSTTPLAILKG